MSTTAGQVLPAGQPVIERGSAADRALLVMGTGEVPEQFGVILLLAADADPHW